MKRRAVFAVWIALALVIAGVGAVLPTRPTAAETVVAVVEVGRGPIGVAANPVTNRVYVANNADNTVSVLDGANNAVVATIADIPLPVNVAVDPATNRVYVTAANGRQGEGTVVVIDGASDAVIATIAVPVSGEGGGLDDVAVNPTTGRVYVTTRDRFGGVDVAVIDGATNAIVARQGADGAVRVAVDPTTARVYVALNTPRSGPTTGALLVLDGATNAVLARIGLDSQPVDVAVNPRTGRVYVATAEGVVVVAGTTAAIVARIAIPRDADGAGPSSIATDPATNRIYAITGETLVVLDGATNAIATTVPRGRRGFDNSQVAVNPATQRIYVTNSAGVRAAGTTVTVFQGDQPPAPTPSPSPAPSPTTGCGTGPFGVASPFNVFVLGDLAQRNTDTEGRVAVGGRGTLTDYRVGAALGTPDAGDVLVVGGALEFSRGRIEVGNAVSGGPGTLANVTFAPGGAYRQGAPLDFAAAGAALRARSSDLAALPVTGSTRLGYGGITLTGTVPGLNVFGIAAADLAAAHTLTIAVPAGATVLLNVGGEMAALRGIGFDLRGVERQRLLLHFPAATALRLENVGVQGTILAPRAAITFDNGVIDGQLIGASLSGTGQANYVPFVGCLSSASGGTPAPGPTSLHTAERGPAHDRWR